MFTNTDQVPVLKSIIEQLCQNSYEDPKNFRVYPITQLLFVWKQETSKFALNEGGAFYSVHIAQSMIDRDQYDYRENLACTVSGYFVHKTVSHNIMIPWYYILFLLFQVPRGTRCQQILLPLRGHSMVVYILGSPVCRPGHSIHSRPPHSQRFRHERAQGRAQGRRLRRLSHLGGAQWLVEPNHKQHGVHAMERLCVAGRVRSRHHADEFSSIGRRRQGFAEPHQVGVERKARGNSGAKCGQRRSQQKDRSCAVGEFAVVSRWR